MNRFRQHIPCYVDVELPGWIEFETTEDLLNLPTVRKFEDYEGFSHFAMSGDLLMMVADDGFY